MSPRAGSRVEVTVSARLSDHGRAPDGNAVEASIRQCVSDAVEGSFDEYPSRLRKLARLRAIRVGNDIIREGASDTEVIFSFGLPAELFPVEQGGLQLLVTFLAGDLFPSEVSGCTWSSVRVVGVELPAELRDRATELFRTNSAHSIDAIRQAFQLPTGRPLLAFSLKPRVGLTLAETRRITLDVLAAGFNIVELDARNLALSSAPFEEWLQLGVEAAGTGPHVTAFSPNFSMPAYQLSEVAQRWVNGISRHGPPVMKVDGGLDGLTGLQSIRMALRGQPAPIVTSYPILRNQLASAIGPSTWVDLLALSGADIVYPGGRPTFPNERRPVWGSHAQDWSRAARSYDSLIARQWPMPTIAGGVHPGHLHACYELMGPNVAFFLGGAVALHPKSPRDGAKLCVSVLEQAIELAKKAQKSGADCSGDLPDGLLKRVEATKYPSASLNYFPPAAIFTASRVAANPPAPFYRRDVG